MNPLGVSGDPSSNDRDVSSSHQGAAPAPSQPTEGQAPATSEPSGPPSGLGENRIPYDRFKKVNDERKELEARVRELESQRFQPPQPQQPQAATNTEVNLQHEIAAAMSDGNYSRAAELQAKLASAEAQRIASSTVDQLTRQQAEAEQMRQLEMTRVNAWQQAIRDFPDLGNENSELFRAAQEIYEGDPYLSQVPNGEYYAAQAAALRVRSNQSSGAQLESGGAANPAQGSPEQMSSAKREEYQRDLNQVRQARTREALEQFVSKWGSGSL